VRETADVETSSDGYAARFSGPVGAWMLAAQERAVLGLLGAPAGATVLDVGGGHGQLALPLAAAGWRVTVLGSDASCARRLAPALAAGRVRFVAGDLLGLPFPDRAFEHVVSVRLLSHCERWPELVAELCRVAHRAVIVDYPTAESLNRAAPALFGAKKRLEGNTRAFTLFTHREVEAAFSACGFAPAGRTAQFFLPMVLHRALRCRPCSAAAEAVCRGLGLTRRWGSPVIAGFVPRTAPATGRRG
jgi:SAM-dependent methyltransferase